MEKKGIIISCFDKTGNMVKPWADAGYECHIVDIQHPDGKTVDGNITKWGMDVKTWEKTFFEENPDTTSHVVFANFFPPCTDLAVSGARWFAEKERKNPGTRKHAMDLVYWSDACGKRLKCPYFIENPVSVISSEWRKPDFTFHPYEYGGYTSRETDGYSKKTCLWTGGGFKMPEKKVVEIHPKLKNKIHYMSPGPERQNKRSATPMGFAQAVFNHYGKKKRKRIKK